MTSNIGASLLLGADTITSDIKNSIESILRSTLKPEFLNRIDAIVYFEKLKKTDMHTITQLQIKIIQNRLQQQNKTMRVDEGVIDLLTDEGYSPEFGARPLKRVIQNLIVSPLSLYLLKNPEAKDIVITREGDAISIS